MTKYHVYHAKTKHIDVRFHKITKVIVIGETVVEKIHILKNVTDMLTKSIIVVKYKHYLGLVNIYSQWEPLVALVEVLEEFRSWGLTLKDQSLRLCLILVV